MIINLSLKLFAVQLVGFKLSRIWETSLGVGIPIVLICLFEVYNLLKKNPLKDQLLDFVHLNKSNELDNHVDNGQNAFGIKVISVAMAIVGVGITVLGIMASNNMPSIIVGLCIITLSIPTWIASKKV